MIRVLKFMKRRYSINSISVYFILTLYTFILYYTDNIDTYFVSQFIYMMIVTIVALSDNNRYKKPEWDWLYFINRKITILISLYKFIYYLKGEIVNENSYKLLYTIPYI